MPSIWATRRASSTSATEQQPESESPPQSFSVAPTTSWPCSIKRPAATDESTPPLMATRTFTDLVCQSPGPLRLAAQLVDHARQYGDDGVDVRFGRLRSEEHTSELQSLRHLVCRLLLEKK